MSIGSKEKKNISKEELKRSYLEEGKTQKECAKIFNCSPTTISRYLKEYNLVGIKSQHEAQTSFSSNTGKYLNKDWLYEKYFVEKLTTKEMSFLCGAGNTTIKRWLKKHGLKARDSSESQKGKKMGEDFCRKQSQRVCGENSPFYGKTHSQESIEKMMEKKMYYPYQGGSVKWYLHGRNDGIKIKLQGTWEFEVARYFDASGIDYKVHGEFNGLPYQIGGKTKVYFPDFYLPEKDLFVEVKGYFNSKMKDKLLRVVKEHQVKIEVWQKKELEEKGILVKNQHKLVREGYYDKYLIDTNNNH